jgi:hypothetical protein
MMLITLVRAVRPIGGNIRTLRHPAHADVQVMTGAAARTTMAGQPGRLCRIFW